MSAGLPLHQAFPAGTWARACVGADTHRLQGRWLPILPSGTPSDDQGSLQDEARTPHGIRLDGAAPLQVPVHLVWPDGSSLGVALEDAAGWLDGDLAWTRSAWRDDLLMFALQPALRALAPVLPPMATVHVQWSTSGRAAGPTLPMTWITDGGPRALALSWPDATAACRALRVLAEVAPGQPDAADERHPDGRDPVTARASTGSDATSRATLRPVLASLMLTASERRALCLGAGLVLPPADETPLGVWIRIGDAWALAGEARAADGVDGMHLSAFGPATPELVLPAVGDDGALQVLGSGWRLSADELAGCGTSLHTPRLHDCELWQGGRRLGSGRLLQRDGARVLQVLEWTP